MRYLYVLLLAAVLVGVQGCAGVANKAADRRSAGTQLEDDTIEKKSEARIQEKYTDAAHVNVTCFNRFVLITGETLGADMKNDVERIVRAVPNVKDIANEIAVGQLSTSATRRTDAGIVSSIKSRIGKNKALQSGTVKVVADKGTVYLLGLSTHAEAAAASEIASTTNNVKKVVRVFEYID